MRLHPKLKSVLANRVSQYKVGKLTAEGVLASLFEWNRILTWADAFAATGTKLSMVQKPLVSKLQFNKIVCESNGVKPPPPPKPKPEATPTPTPAGEAPPKKAFGRRKKPAAEAVPA